MDWKTYDAVTVIPARYGSTRLPGKPLADISGKPMIQWVYERAAIARGVDLTVVATDDARIEAVVKGFGGQVIMTPSDLASGTDRVAYAARLIRAKIYINVQGDEPLIGAEEVEGALAQVRSGRFEMGSAMTPFGSDEDRRPPSVVKVVVGPDRRALKFSRADLGPESFRHLGIYSYTAEKLDWFSKADPTENEKSERLEQLRALDHGVAIGMALVNSRSFGIDVPEDLVRAREIVSVL